MDCELRNLHFIDAAFCDGKLLFYNRETKFFYSYDFTSETIGFIEVNGVENLLKLLKNDVEIVTIFLKVPKEELRKRLEEREDNQSAEEIELRLNRLEYEESKIGMYDYVIKNDNLERTLRIIEEIIKT